LPVGTAFEIDFPSMNSVSRQIVNELVPLCCIHGNRTVNGDIDKFVETSACETKIIRDSGIPL